MSSINSTGLEYLCLTAIKIDWIGTTVQNVGCLGTSVKAATSVGGEGMDLGTSVLRTSHKCSTISKLEPTDIG